MYSQQFHNQIEVIEERMKSYINWWKRDQLHLHTHPCIHTILPKATMTITKQGFDSAQSQSRGEKKSRNINWYTVN